ncbi:MAG: hypothetical protein CFE44_06220 [Burkholderiales bacterium PBB4]|nr:MAG: hypothetical protein CFE44_06220 [Burkholderiales bacterium PBB4]
MTDISLLHVTDLAPGVTPQDLGLLRLQAGQHPEGRVHLSAASGLVRSGSHLFVVADDELYLGVFDDLTAKRPTLLPGRLVALLAGELPHDKAARKKAKPDLESLALLPPLPGYAEGALLALGSGSQPNRETGVLLGLATPGVLSGHTALVNLAPLYAPLRAHFADLNIEGAWVADGALVLLQRGNQGDARSACIRFDWSLVAPWLVGRQPLPPAAHTIQVLNLGRLKGVPLSLTDGVPLAQGDWMFSAVAEDTADSVADGACVGSALGIVSAQGHLKWCGELYGAPKVEGIAVQARADGWQVTMVTDPDDPARASQCLRAFLPASAV